MPNEPDEELADHVLFESDKTCCVCHDRSRPVKIHHLDGNHSNNVRSNLVVLCDPCHTAAHTKAPFSRNLTPSLIRLYDAFWRAACTARLAPHQVDAATDEYRREVLLELSVACHRWKNAYAALQPPALHANPGSYKDAWDVLINEGRHQDSPDEWTEYQPLFRDEIDRTIAAINSVLSCHASVIPPSLKTTAIRTIRQLFTEQSVFINLGPDQTSVKARSKGVLEALATLACDADAGSGISPVTWWFE
jgi:hypothetical protein